MSALTSIFELLRSTVGINRSPEETDKLRELWSVANASARLTKRQAEINVLERISLLLAMGNAGGHVHVDFIFGSLSVYGSAVKGVCVIHLRQVEFLLRDCEHALIRKQINIATPGPNRMSVSSRRRSMVSRRSSVAAVTITPDLPPEPNFDSIMDLDALCEELNRRTMAPSPQQRRVFVNKRSRSNSCSSSTSHVTADQNPFEPLLPLADDVLDMDIPFIVTPTTPSVEHQRVPLKGYDPKVCYTSIQWARHMREPPTLPNFHQFTPLSYILSNPILNVAIEYSKRLRLVDDATSVRRPSRHRRRLDRRPLPAHTPEPEPDNISIVDAVDGDYEPIDELRGFDNSDIHDDNLLTHHMNNRVSLGGSSDAVSDRRMSIASELLHKRRDSLSSVGSGLEYCADEYQILDEPTALRTLIREELEERGKKTNTLLGLHDVCPIGHTSRSAAVKTLCSILILASQGEARINREVNQTFSNENFCFSLRGGSDDSSSSSTS